MSHVMSVVIVFLKHHSILVSEEIASYTYSLTLPVYIAEDQCEYFTLYSTFHFSRLMIMPCYCVTESQVTRVLICQGPHVYVFVFFAPVHRFLQLY